jgi:hypothetical protein
MKTPAKSGQPWTKQDDAQLKQLAKENTPTRVMGIKLQRTPAAIASHASAIGISLKPTNQRPYGRQK